MSRARAHPLLLASTPTENPDSPPNDIHLLRFALALPLLACFLPACGGAASDPYLGTWVLDPGAEQAGESSTSPGPPAGVEDGATPGASLELVLTIHEDGRFELDGVGSPVDVSSSDTWELVEDGLQLSGGMTGTVRLQDGLLTFGSESDGTPLMVYRRGD